MKNRKIVKGLVIGTQVVVGMLAIAAVGSTGFTISKAKESDFDKLKKKINYLVNRIIDPNLKQKGINALNDEKYKNFSNENFDELNNIFKEIEAQNDKEQSNIDAEIKKVKSNKIRKSLLSQKITANDSNDLNKVLENARQTITKEKKVLDKIENATLDDGDKNNYRQRLSNTASDAEIDSLFSEVVNSITTDLEKFRSKTESEVDKILGTPKHDELKKEVIKPSDASKHNHTKSEYNSIYKEAERIFKEHSDAVNKHFSDAKVKFDALPNGESNNITSDINRELRIAKNVVELKLVDRKIDLFLLNLNVLERDKKVVNDDLLIKVKVDDAQAQSKLNGIFTTIKQNIHDWLEKLIKDSIKKVKGMDYSAGEASDAVKKLLAKIEQIKGTLDIDKVEENIQKTKEIIEFDEFLDKLIKVIDGLTKQIKLLENTKQAELTALINNISSIDDEDTSLKELRERIAAEKQKEIDAAIAEIDILQNINDDQKAKYRELARKKEKNYQELQDVVAEAKSVTNDKK